MGPRASFGVVLGKCNIFFHLILPLVEILPILLGRLLLSDHNIRRYYEKHI